MRDLGQLSDDEWLDAFVSQWHLLADLSFSALVLWKPLTEEGMAGFVSGASLRMRQGGG